VHFKTHGSGENKPSVRPLHQTMLFASDSKTRSHIFVRQNLLVTLISVPFSPTRSLHLALSHSTKKLFFSHPKETSPKSLIITYLSKSLKLAFHTKPQVSSQNFDSQNL